LWVWLDEPLGVWVWMDEPLDVWVWLDEPLDVWVWLDKPLDVWVWQVLLESFEGSMKTLQELADKNQRRVDKLEHVCMKQEKEHSARVGELDSVYTVTPPYYRGCGYEWVHCHSPGGLFRVPSVGRTDHGCFYQGGSSGRPARILQHTTHEGYGGSELDAIPQGVREDQANSGCVHRPWQGKRVGVAHSMVKGGCGCGTQHGKRRVWVWHRVKWGVFS